MISLHKFAGKEVFIYVDTIQKLYWIEKSK